MVIYIRGMCHVKRELKMAIVNRMWEGVGMDRRLVISDVRGIESPYEISLEDGIRRLGGRDAAIEYGIKAACSDAGSGGKTARDKIDAARRWLEGSPDAAAVVAEYQRQMAEMAEEIRRLREALPGRA